MTGARGSRPPSDFGEMLHPKTGKPAPTKDMREEFARISRQSGRDPEAERAFVVNKIEMIRSHPTLSNREKASAIAELEARLRRSKGK
jgi:hypothetical protein